MYIKEYEKWLQQFEGGYPSDDYNSIVGCRVICNLNESWQVRLQVAPLFAAIWGTDKLLTSFDCVSIARPPEEGETKFSDEVDHWFHIDQGHRKIGLHAIQGAVYLEEAQDDDWCLEVW